MKEKIKNKSNIQTHYHLKLFVAGDEPNSYKAKKTIERLCESCLKGNYKLEVVDVLKDYQVALDNNILIAPTLVIVAPPPQTTIIGSLSETRKILDALGLSESGEKR